MDAKGTAQLPQLMRRIRAVYIATVALYVLLGFVLVASAFAQMSSQSALMPAPSTAGMKVPTGSSDSVVQSYYHYLQLQELGGMTERYLFTPRGLIEFYGAGGILLVVMYFLMFAWYARRKRDDLYPVEVYNGYITERGGRIDAFNWAVWAIMLAYAVMYVSMSLIFGQLY